MIAQFCEAPELYTIDAPAADTQYSLALGQGVKAIRVQCRDATDVRIAFTAGKVTTPTDPYHTIKSGTVFEKNGMFMNKTTLYVATGGTNKKVEVLVWR